MLDNFISFFDHEFAMIDIGFLIIFLGIKVTRLSSGLHLSQPKYVMELLERPNMFTCHPVHTHVV